MQLKLKVIPNSKLNIVETELDGSLKVKLTSVPEKGKANKQLIDILAKHYNIKTSAVKILKGHTYSKKLVEIKL